MKKTILTTVIALFCLSASAQFSVMSNVTMPEEGASWSMDNFTSNLGVGYQLNNDVMVGVQQNGDDYDFIGRYNLKDNLYLSVQMPTEDAADNMTLGMGMSVKVWNELYVEPNYTRKDDEGSFNIGLSYKL
jgi:opacity protein-like surface antigen|tara:strand:+ start:5557 stop:5949 length:393 start_codon:yes stop_codon:yes gene_type:complete